MTDLNQPGSTERAIALADVHAAINHHAHTARNDVEWETKLQCFTTYAEIVLPNAARLPISKMREMLRGNEAKYYRHHITSVDIQFINADIANVASQLFVITHMSTHDHWGEWQDRLTRGEDGQWRIAEKTLVVDGCDPKAWYAETYGQI